MFPIFISHQFQYSKEGIKTLFSQDFKSIFALDGLDFFKETKDTNNPLVQKMIQRKIQHAFKNISEEKPHIFKGISESNPLRILTLWNKTDMPEIKGLAVFLETKHRQFPQLASFEDITHDAYLTMQKISPIPVYLANSNVYPHLEKDLGGLKKQMDALDFHDDGDEISINLDFQQCMKNLEQIFERNTLNKSTNLVQHNHSLNRL